MKRSLVFPAIAAALAALSLAAPAFAQDEADALRATKMAGEQEDGLLGVPPGANPGPEVRRRIDAVNILRRTYYTDLAAKRGVPVNDVRAATACQLLGTKVDVGEWYFTEATKWRQRTPNEPVPLPDYCGAKP